MMVAVPSRDFSAVADMMAQIEAKISRINLDNMTISPPAPSADDQHLAAAALRVFSTPDGKAVLEHLADLSVRALRMPMPLGVDPMQAYAHGQRCEGRCDLFFAVLELLKVAQTPSPAPEQDHDNG